MVAGRARISRNVKSERSYRTRSHPRRYPQISGKKVDYDYDYEHEHDTVENHATEGSMSQASEDAPFTVGLEW
jgi:hypothetical protein